MPSAFDGYYPDGYDDGDQSGTHAGKQPRMIHDFELKTCHDIRHMKLCDACGGMGDDRQLVRLDGIKVYSSYHDQCAVSAFGHEILKLPTEELNKFSIGATGGKLMKAICEEVNRREA